MIAQNKNIVCYVIYIIELKNRKENLATAVGNRRTRTLSISGRTC